VRRSESPNIVARITPKILYFRIHSVAHKLVRIASLPLCGANRRHKFSLLLATMKYLLVSGMRKLTGDNEERYALSKVMPQTYIRLHGSLFKIRRNSDDIIFLQPFHEPLTTHKLIESIENGIFIDIGAHVGRYSIIIANKLDGKGRVIAVEPERNNFVALLENIKLNNLENVIPINNAICDKSRRLPFYYTNVVGSGFSSLVQKWENKVEVDAVTLDHLLDKLKIVPSEVKLVKIDVEGTEYSVLRGAKKFLKSSDAKIIFESGPETIDKCCKLLRKFGYRVSPLGNENFLAIKMG